jgi:CAP12/Pycsar effector protein, TIR domain
MAKSKIFISSSPSALCIADKLRDELTTDYCETDVWKEAIRTNAGQTKIETLEQLAKTYDFAVIVLTKADVAGRPLQSSIGDRDNCVFEAGLFMGVIGRNRCFFVSSAAKSELPSDLEGIIIFTFSEPNDLSNREACGNAIRSVSSNIKDSVQEARRQNTPRGGVTRPLSRDELLDREQLDPYGDLQEDQVIVASLQPLDLKYETALRVWNNLNNNISYVYFFEANTDTADKIPQLLQLLLLAGIVGIPNQVNTSFQQRRELVKANRAKIIEASRDLCVNNKLNVYFTQERVDIEYCIHNATSDKFAKLYLKRGNEFFEWYSSLAAYNFWTEMRKKKGADNPDPGIAMFHGGRVFELKKGPFLNNLTMGMRKYFPDYGDEVLQICLGSDYTQNQGVPAGAAGPQNAA